MSRTLILLLAFCWSLSAVAEPQYVGSQRCQQCHIEEYSSWQQSDHHKAMQSATKESVLGDFSEVSVNFHGIKSRLFQKNELNEKGTQFFIETLGRDNKQSVFPIKYTFGFYPLQQYLVETEKGHIQALNIAWDSRPQKQGGQRWFHLQPDEKITSEHPFFWPRHFQNWNSRCAQCHSTNVELNYDADENSYDTSFSEINVGCEACHGPASNHLKNVQKGLLVTQGSGFSKTLGGHLRWQFTQGDPIANPVGKANDRHINMCGGCHSRRAVIADADADLNANYHDQYRLQLLEEGVYFPDGQIQDEDFVLGSFLQSKMQQNGVTCSNCHNPHSGKLLLEGNGLCAQCHVPTVYDNSNHHHHPSSSEGAQCVNCHMPDRLYMQVDNRRDHSFSIPRPDLSESLGVPNACVDCHSEKTDSWAKSTLEDWGALQTKTHWASVNQRSRQYDPLVLEPLIAEITQPAHAPIVHATLLQQLAAFPSPATVEAAKKGLQDSDPLVRRAAVAALQDLPASTRWPLLAPYINDDSRSVRFELAQNLADVFTQLPEGDRAGLHKLMAEYRQSLLLTQDAPSTQLAIASLDLRLGDTSAALNGYKKALAIEPNYVPALVNLSDYYRALGQSDKEQPLLKKALSVAPDSAMVNHSYGLYLIRQKKYQDAVSYLATAITTAGAVPRYAYVYAVALDSAGETRKAISALYKANERWPNQYDLLLTLISYLEKTGNTMAIYKPLSVLRKVAPDSPEVSRLVRKYSQSS